MANYTPRLTADGIYLSKYYYDENPFYLSGYGLPNCTCYAWGRFYETYGIRPGALPRTDAGTWFDKVVSDGYYRTGSTPELGAIACYASTIGGDGHLSVVESLRVDGSFVVSQSGYYRPIAEYPPDTEDYFWTDVCGPSTNKPAWMTNYVFQGFIYNPEYTPPVLPRKRKMPVWMYTRRF